MQTPATKTCEYFEEGSKCYHALHVGTTEEYCLNEHQGDYIGDTCYYMETDFTILVQTVTSYTIVILTLVQEIDVLN